MNKWAHLPIFRSGPQKLLKATFRSKKVGSKGPIPSFGGGHRVRASRATLYSVGKKRNLLGNQQVDEINETIKKTSLVLWSKLLTETRFCSKSQPADKPIVTWNSWNRGSMPDKFRYCLLVQGAFNVPACQKASKLRLLGSCVSVKKKNKGTTQVQLRHFVDTCQTVTPSSDSSGGSLAPSSR